MLKFALNEIYETGLADGTHDITEKMIVPELQEAYAMLTDEVGLLRMVVVNGAVSKAYRAQLGLMDGNLVLKNGDEIVPITNESVTFCRSFVYACVKDKDVLGQDEFCTLSVGQFMELTQPTNYVRVEKKKVPDGVYDIISIKEIPYADRTFLEVVLKAAKVIEVFGETYNYETKEKDFSKYKVDTFATTLNACYRRSKKVAFAKGQTI